MTALSPLPPCNDRNLVGGYHCRIELTEVMKVFFREQVTPEKRYTYPPHNQLESGVFQTQVDSIALTSISPFVFTTRKQIGGDGELIFWIGNTSDIS